MTVKQVTDMKRKCSVENLESVSISNHRGCFVLSLVNVGFSSRLIFLPPSGCFGVSTIVPVIF